MYKSRTKIFTILIILLFSISSRILGQQLTGTWDVNVSPNGQYIATSSDTLTIYDTTGSIIQTLSGHTDATIITAWSPDGSVLASGGLDNYVRLWDTSTWTMINEIATNSNQIYELSWRPDGAVLLGNSFDTFYIWDTTTWNLLIDPISVTLTDIEWIDNTKFVFSGTPTYIGVATFVNNSLTINVLSGHLSTPYAITLSPTADRIASAGGEDGTIRLWDTASNLEIAKPLDGQEIVTDVVFIDSSHIITSTQQGNLYTIDTITNTIIDTQNFGTSIRTIAWNDITGQLIIAGANNNVPVILTPQSTSCDSTISASDVASLISAINTGDSADSLDSNCQENNDNNFDAVGTSDAGVTQSQSPLESVQIAYTAQNNIVALGFSNEVVELWDISTNELMSTISSPLPDASIVYAIQDMSFSPDGNQLAISYGGYDNPGILQIIDSASGQIRHIFNEGSFVGDIAWSPDGSLITAKVIDGLGNPTSGHLRVWETSSGNLITDTYMGANTSASGLDWSPDGTQLISAHIENTLILWDTEFWSPTTMQFLADKPLTDVAWTDDGLSIIAVDTERTIYVWDSTTGNRTHTINTGLLSNQYDIDIIDNKAVVNGLTEILIIDLDNDPIFETFPEPVEDVLWLDETSIIYSDADTFNITDIEDITCNSTDSLDSNCSEE